MDNFSESIKNMTFEQMLSELEKTVKSLESGDAPLADSMELYKKGVFLASECEKMLENAENEVNVLVSAGDGTMKEENFRPARPAVGN